MKIDHPKVVAAIRAFSAEHSLALGLLTLGLWTMPFTAPYLDFVGDVVRFDLYSLRHANEIVERERAAQADLDRHFPMDQK